MFHLQTIQRLDDDGDHDDEPSAGARCECEREAKDHSEPTAASMMTTVGRDKVVLVMFFLRNIFLFL